MSSTDPETAELFAAPLASPEGDATTPASYPPFQSGVYRLRGEAMTGGRYKRGRFEGKPYGRFTFQIAEGAHQGRQVSYMLPWLAGQPRWEPFHAAFAHLTGWSSEQFDQYCNQQSITDPQTRLSAMLKRFIGAQFQAEVRPSTDAQGREWLNVWNIVERVSDPGSVAAETGSATESQAETQSETPASPAENGAGTLNEIQRLAEQLQLDQSVLSRLCQEEFSLGEPAQLDEAAQAQLRDLLQERVLLQQPEPSQPADDLPF